MILGMAIMATIAIVPQPAELVPGQGEFVVKPNAVIVATGDAQPVGEYFAALVKLPVKTAATGTPIILQLDAKRTGLGDEGYDLEITSQSVKVWAQKPAGLFYGVQTLRQLWNDGKLPAVKIHDAPRFQWRGLMLDVCRHFRDKEFVKRYIDYLAYHKLNTLHWHLTEDQGWRIEIKKYPKLTEIGAWRGANRYGGFYTQDDIREVVAYAASRYITVVPEIEMPGHSLAALAAYPELSCTGGPFKVWTKWGITADIYCAGNDKTFEFLTDVLDEVMALFPSPFIHIGGDEAPKSRWKTCPKCQQRIKDEGLHSEHELQSYFIRRIEKHLNAKGRRLIGWTEIREGGLAENAAVMDWKGGAVESARDGHDVVMSPTSYCYLDYSYSRISLEKAYSFEPIPRGLTGKERDHILGLQGNMWSEHTPEPSDVDRQVWPRLCALAEIGWSPAEGRSYEEFLKRMRPHTERLAVMGLEVQLPTPPVGNWTAQQVTAEYQPLEWDVTKYLTAPGTYSVEFAYSKGRNGLSIQSVALYENGKELALDTHDGFAGWVHRNHLYTVDLPAVKAGATYTIRATVRGDGGADSNGEVKLQKK